MPTARAMPLPQLPAHQHLLRLLRLPLLPLRPLAPPAQEQHHCPRRPTGLSLSASTSWLHGSSALHSVSIADAVMWGLSRAGRPHPSLTLPSCLPAAASTSTPRCRCIKASSCGPGAKRIRRGIPRPGLCHLYQSLCRYLYQGIRAGAAQLPLRCTRTRT